MQRTRFLLALTAVVLVTVVHGADPIPKQGNLKQRVNPKLLREAMAIQEYQAKATATSASSVDDLQRLHEKLKKNGDDADAAMVEKFIHEHQRLVTQSIRHLPCVSGKLIVHARVIEVRPGDLPPELVTHGKTVSDLSRIDVELERLEEHHKAKICKKPMLIENDATIPIRCFEDGEFALPVHNDHSTRFELPTLGASFEVHATLINNQKVRLKSTCETIEDDPDNIVVVDGVRHPGKARHKTETVYDLNFGEAAIESIPLEIQKRGFVVIMEVTPRT